MLRGVVVAALSAVSVVAVSAQTVREVDIPMADGVVLKGSYFAPQSGGAAVLLLPQCDKDRRAWRAVATDLAAAGMHVLTIDFRGLGESGGKPSSDEERRTLSAKWPKDVDAALAFLIGRQGVDSGRIAVGGASCGVPQASAAAQRQRSARALLLLSGPAMDDARAYIAKTPGLAVFGAAAAQDIAAVQGSKDLVGASTNPASTLKVYDGTAHGVELLAANKDLQTSLVTWLAQQLSGTKR